MQNRFKFRFWDKETQTMQKIPMVELRHRIALDKIFADDRVIFMQCTGLKDKNDKLVYEGDIIVNEKFVKYITKWNDNIGQFYISKINPSKYDNWKDWHLARHDLDYEVIGNIYENPELLEVK